MNAKISVIIPVYNVEKYVGECLESAINQTLKEIEIVCVDDCGSDGSMKIVEEYAAKDTRVHIYRHERNSGLSTARNTGINNSSAPYIMFLDSDDFYAPTMCETMLHAIEDSHADIAACGIHVIYEANKEWKKSDDKYYSIKFSGLQQVTDHVVLNCDVSAWNKIYRRELLEEREISFPDGLKYEDAYFFYAYMSQAQSVFFIKEKLYHYRRRSDSTMNETFDKTSSFSIDHLRIAIALYDYFEAHGVLEKKYSCFAKLFFAYMDFSLAHASSEQQKEEIYRMAKEFAQKAFRDTDALPFMITRRIELLLNKRPQNKGLFPLFGIKEKAHRTIFYLLFLPFLKIKYSEKYQKYCLLGIQIYKKQRGINAKFAAKKFHSFSFDDSHLLTHLKQAQPFTFIPNPGNMGGMLIAAASLRFFDRHKLNYSLLRDAQNKDILVYGGGGIWTKDYERHWTRFLPLFRSAKKIIILPSSFCDCPKLLEVMDSRFVVFCREKQSYNYLIQAGTEAQVLLDHDMAFRMDKKMLGKTVLFSSDEERSIWKDEKRIMRKLCPFFAHPSKNIGLFLRNDCEKAHSFPTDIDLSSHVYGDEFAPKSYINFCARVMLCAVDSVDAIVTDRLHVGIAALLMGKEVWFLDNSYRKVSNVYEHSIKDIALAHFTDSIPQDICPQHTATDNFAKLAESILGKRETLHYQNKS